MLIKDTVDFIGSATCFFLHAPTHSRDTFAEPLHTYIAQSGFFRWPVFSSQSELFKNFSDCSDWLEKSWPLQKSHFCFDHEITLKVLDNESINDYCSIYNSWASAAGGRGAVAPLDFQT